MLQIVDYTRDFLEKSWVWLNDPEIKRITNTPDFSKEEQERWFEKLNQEKRYKIWGISYDGINIGAFGIKNIENGIGEYWGYIGEKEYWGKGIGRLVVREAITYARRFGLHRLYLRVMKINNRAIRLYQRMNFVVTKEDGISYIMETEIDDQIFRSKKI